MRSDHISSLCYCGMAVTQAGAHPSIIYPCNDKQPVSTSTCHLPHSNQGPTPANNKWNQSKNRCTIPSMSPNPPLYMLKKAPRFIPGLGTLTLLAVGGFVVGRSSVKDSNVSTAEPAQRTPWPPPLNDALDDDIRPYVRSRFQTREVSHRGRQSECTDRDWVCVLVLFFFSGCGVSSRLSV